MNSALNFDTAQRFKVTLIRSASGRIPKHKATLNSMGLRRIGQSVNVVNNKAMLGMIRAIHYLVKIESE